MQVLDIAPKSFEEFVLVVDGLVTVMISPLISLVSPCMQCRVSSGYNSEPQNFTR